MDRTSDRARHADCSSRSSSASTTSSSSRSCRASCPRHQQKRARRVGPAGGHGHAARAPVSRSVWIARLTAAALHVMAQEISRARSDPDRRRPVPAGQGHLRDPRQARRGASTRPAGSGASFAQRHRPGHAARHRLLARLGHHGHRHGRRPAGHGRGRGPRRAASCLSRPSRSARSSRMHPTIKILALSFLLLIGMSLLAEGSASTFRRATSTSRWASRSSSR